jgi:hypothetical protein
MNLIEVVFNCVDWIQLAKNTAQWLAFMNLADLSGRQKSGKSHDRLCNY